jgi:hypothetical protein
MTAFMSGHPCGLAVPGQFLAALKNGAEYREWLQ